MGQLFGKNAIRFLLHTVKKKKKDEMNVCMCGRLNNSPKDTQVLIVGTCECYLILRKRFCRCNSVKDLKWKDHPRISGYTLNVITSVIRKGKTKRDLTTEET